MKIARPRVAYFCWINSIFWDIRKNHNRQQHQGIYYKKTSVPCAQEIKYSGVMRHRILSNVFRYNDQKIIPKDQ